MLRALLLLALQASPPPVTYAASAGTITTGGRYTAPATASGTATITVTVLGRSVTVPVTFVAPSARTGTPLVAYSLYNLGDGEAFGLPLGGHDGVSPSLILDRIADARAKHRCLVLAMTAGHTPYLTNGVFDRAKWEARMRTFNTAAIRQAVALGVADGTICGANVMDEPHVSGLGDGNTWGPRGTMTKLRVDSLCQVVRGLFPTLPAGVAHQPQAFEPTKSYHPAWGCQFTIAQYATATGSLTAFRDGALAMAARDGLAVLFSMNVLNGGIQAPRDGLWTCPLTTTGGRGTYDPNCRMTPAQVRTNGLTLGVAGCGMVFWRWDAGFLSKPENQAALRAVADSLVRVPRRACRRA